MGLASQGSRGTLDCSSSISSKAMRLFDLFDGELFNTIKVYACIVRYLLYLYGDKRSLPPPHPSAYSKELLFVTG